MLDISWLIIYMLDWSMDISCPITWCIVQDLMLGKPCWLSTLNYRVCSICLSFFCIVYNTKLQHFQKKQYKNYLKQYPWFGAKIILKQLSPTCTYMEVNNCFSMYHTSWLSSGPKSNFICDNILTKAIDFVFLRLLRGEFNSTWLITSELANQCARKVLFTCVVYT